MKTEQEIIKEIKVNDNIIHDKRERFVKGEITEDEYNKVFSECMKSILLLKFVLGESKYY